MPNDRKKVLLVLVPGTAGLRKRDILYNFGTWVDAFFEASKGQELGTIRPFQVFVKEPETGGVRNLLDSTLNPQARRACVREALRGVRVSIDRKLHELIKNGQSNKYLVCFIPVHLVGYRHGEFTLIYTPSDFDECLGPIDMLVTLIDNVYDAWARMVFNEIKSPQRTYVSLRETSQWRSTETMIADFLAQHLTAWKRTWIKKAHELTELTDVQQKWIPEHIKEWLNEGLWFRESMRNLMAPWEVRNYVLAISHPRVTLFRLIQRALIAKFTEENKDPISSEPIQNNDKTPGPIYASYPISEPRKLEGADIKTAVATRKRQIEKINEYRRTLHKKLIVFDPVTIDDRILFVTEEKQSQVEQLLSSDFQQIITQPIKNFNENENISGEEWLDNFRKPYGMKESEEKKKLGNISWYGPCWQHQLCQNTSPTHECGLCPLQKETAWNRVPFYIDDIKLEFAILPEDEVTSLQPSFHFEPSWVGDHVNAAADVAPVPYSHDKGIFWRVTESGYVDNLIAARDFRLIEQSDGLIALTKVKEDLNIFSGGVRREIAYAFGIGMGWVCAVFRTFWDTKDDQEKLEQKLEEALKDVSPFDDEVLIVDSPETAIKVMFPEIHEKLATKGLLVDVSQHYNGSATANK